MIRFDKVVKTYLRTERPALDGIDLVIEEGEFVFLVGPSGSGKSTIVRLITREEALSSGELTVAGRDLRTIPRRQIPALRREVGTVFQDFRLLPDKTVEQNVAYVLNVLGESPETVRSAVPEVLQTVGLAGLGKRRPHELSGGEQQRVAIARALVRRPRILLADEPTGNLDPSTSLEIVRLLEDINASGTTVVMATHDDRIVDELRRRVVQLDHGRIVRDEAAGGYLRAQGSPAETSSGRPPGASEPRRPDVTHAAGGVPTEKETLTPMAAAADASVDHGAPTRHGVETHREGDAR